MDYLGREIFLFPYWLERKFNEQDESLPESVYEDFYAKLEISEHLFDWSRELVRGKAFRAILGVRVAELGHVGLEVYHYRNGILDTVHEGWSCLAVKENGNFLVMEGTKQAGMSHSVNLTCPEEMAHRLPISLLKEVRESVCNDEVYRTMSRPIWQVDIDALTAAKILSGEWVDE